MDGVERFDCVITSDGDQRIVHSQSIGPGMRQPLQPAPVGGVRLAHQRSDNQLARCLESG